ncbi:hypothetical protein ACHAXT_004132 [Thalassiosira profunda]
MSLALPEAILWVVLCWICRFLEWRANGGRRSPLDICAAIVPPLLLILAVLAFIFATCTLETATLWYARRSAPWDLAYDIWNNWSAYRGMGESKRGELGVVLECEMGGAVAVMAGQWVGAGWLRRLTEQRWMHLKYRVWGRRKSHEADRSYDGVARVEKCLGRQQLCSRSRRSGVFYAAKRDRMWQRTVIVLVCASMVRFRPDQPYGDASGSTYLEAPVEISTSFVQGWEQRKMVAKAKEKQSGEKSSAGVAPPIPATYTDDGSLKNVVVIFLESARADLIPFDHSTAWAKEKVLPSVVEEASKAAREGKPNIITPFYSALTRNETSSLYLPIKSTSGVTLKSVLATLCGVYPHPSDHTNLERLYGLYQKCLPHLMAERGASSKFFLSMVTGFDDQNVLVDKMGFTEGIYGKEQYDEEHHPSEEDRLSFEMRHNIGYFGYEDNVMLDPVLEWVDSKAAAKSPFFLVYEAGITHHPFGQPPNWPYRYYSDHSMVNGFLNEAAYMDDFLARFLGGFESRNLAQDTLFVLVGDHGVALGDRDRDNLFHCDWEGAFNVGLTFHSGNPAAAKRLKKVAEVHRRLSRKSTDDRKETGVYTSIDVLPTVLDLLGHPDAASSREGRSLLRAPFDGKKVSVSYMNPGADLVLREGHWMCVSSDKGWGRPTLYDLSVDPDQERPIRLSHKTDGESKASGEKENQSSPLERWGEIAARFLRQLRRDLETTYEIGERCDNCTLSVLASSDSLDQWHGIETELDSSDFEHYDESEWLDIEEDRS